MLLSLADDVELRTRQCEHTERISLAPTTVRNYLSTAIDKVGGRNRIDAIRIARNTGWL
jgi:two-component system response regulator DesR